MKIKGFHMELRGQRMRTEKIIDSMKDAAKWGYTHMMLEYCDKFPYGGRIADAVAPDALTKEEIQSIKRAAKDFGLEIIPLVQCLGHLYWALRRPSLVSLGDGYDPSKIDVLTKERALTSLCPSRPTAMEFFKEMAAQVLEMHPESKYFHIGGDEVKLNPDCKDCAPRRDSEGMASILGKHYLGVVEWIKAHGKEPVMWCDMLLANPDSLNLLKDKVTVMDWDYWSTDKPAPSSHLWGIPADKRSKPEEWPEAQKQFAKYILAEEGKIKPFPYTPILKDNGFDVIIAPAARSAGDTFFAPKTISVDNVIGAAKSASRNKTLGVVVTSWALRRSPWPLTEYALMAGIMTMENPDIEHVKIDTKFAEEHFGVSDPELARIPQLLGMQSNPLTIAANYMDPVTGQWLANDYSSRLPKMTANSEANLKYMETKKHDVLYAQKLLEKAKPTTDWQRERVKMWDWSLRCTLCFAELIPEVLKQPGAHDLAELKKFRERIVSLQEETEKLLGPWMSDWTMIAERQSRFQIHLDWIDEMLRKA